MNQKISELLKEAKNKIDEALTLLNPKEVKEEKKGITLDEIRAELTSFARKGFTSDIRDIITGFGVNKLSELDPKHYEEVLSRVRDIANGR